MDIHKNARRTLRSREQLALFVLAGNSLCAVRFSSLALNARIFLLPRLSLLWKTFEMCCELQRRCVSMHVSATLV